jgi:phosphohistidine phosphatase
MSSQKILYILRHAKAETGNPHQDDHDRHITQVGIDAATAMGQHFSRQGVRPDLVICSSAVRARETWATVQEAYGRDVPVQYNERLYLASVNETMQLVGAVGEAVQRLLIVGHNPGLHQFSLKLAKSGSASLMNTIGIKFPTCAFATVALGDTPWKDLAFAHGELKGFVTPSMLGDLEE